LCAPLAYINWLKHPLHDSIEGLETGFKHGVAGGNPAFATACAYNLMGTFWSVIPLPQIAPLIGTTQTKPLLSFRMAAN
jgi:hypothetical protein